MTATTHPEFHKESEASDVATAFPDAIKGRTILITGVGKEGIGHATAEAFASQAPERLILAGRTPARIEDCVKTLKSEYPKIDVRPLIVDLASLKSVKEAGTEVVGWTDVPKIHIVINNAGIMRHGESSEGGIPRSADGIEDQFATNHLGHFYLTNLIMPKIIAAAQTSTAGSCRVVNLSSSGAWVSPFRASDLEWKQPSNEVPENERPNFAMMKMAGMAIKEETSYIPTAAYGQSKACNVLFSVGLNERLFNRYGILSMALNPGEIQTDLGRYTDKAWLERAIAKRKEMGLMHWKTKSQGSSTTLVAACDPKLTLPDGDGNGYFLDNCQIGKAPPWCVDKAVAEKLWKISEDLTGQNFQL
jgi:NAD(P)-dependent dehydrogenase (short-subunit alcohol dehydrogenase family)